MKCNSVCLPLVDVVEFSVVFAPKVFVQSFGVSCHCGLQSTVVHSRVRQLKLLDLQRNWFWGGIQCGWKSLFKLVCCVPIITLKSAQYEFGAVVSILFVPVKIWTCGTGLKCTVKCKCLSFSSNDICCWLDHSVLSFTLCGRREHAEEEMNQ